jgi:hypothetical protein
VSWSPIWANLHVFGEIGAKLRAARGWREAWLALFGHPGWRPASLGPRIVPGPVSPDSFRKYEPPVPGALRAYALIQFVVVLVASVALLNATGSMTGAAIVAASFHVLLSLGNIGGVLESRRWTALTEPARLLALAVAAALLGLTGTLVLPLAALALLFALGSLLWFLRLLPRLTSSDVRAIVAM